MKIDSYLGTSVLSERSELNGNLVVSRAFTFNTTAGSCQLPAASLSQQHWSMSLVEFQL
jgi:hypothetical protein